MPRDGGPNEETHEAIEKVGQISSDEPKSGNEVSMARGSGYTVWLLRLGLGRLPADGQVDKWRCSVERRSLHQDLEFDSKERVVELWRS